VLKIAQDAAQKAGLVLVRVDYHNQQDIADGFAMLARELVGAVMFPGDPVSFLLRNRIAEMALEARLPTMFPQREYVEAGGLMSYGESLADFYRRAAFYVDKIFKGAKPAELPIQQPTRFFLTINRKTAEAFGITIPLQALVLADEVIELVVAIDEANNDLGWPVGHGKTKRAAIDDLIEQMDERGLIEDHPAA
jgi:putative ABC transport system substrate-binding protein